MHLARGIPLFFPLENDAKPGIRELTKRANVATSLRTKSRDRTLPNAFGRNENSLPLGKLGITLIV